MTGRAVRKMLHKKQFVFIVTICVFTFIYILNENLSQTNKHVHFTRFLSGVPKHVNETIESHLVYDASETKWQNGLLMKTPTKRDINLTVQLGEHKTIISNSSELVLDGDFSSFSTHSPHGPGIIPVPNLTHEKVKGERAKGISHELIHRPMVITHFNVKANGTQSKWISDGNKQRQKGGQYHGIDLMSLPPYQFDPGYKNPCWKNNGTLRCLPYFFIIGVKKCGTSELWKHLIMHPEFVIPNFGKEAQWFARRRFQTKRTRGKPQWSVHPPGQFESYIDLFQRVAEHLHQSQNNLFPRGKSSITADASPSNLHLNSHWRYLPGNENLEEPRYVILDYIQHFLPKAKIIIIFRDPVERLYSDYYHQYGRLRKLFNPTPQHFHQIVVLGLRLYKECLDNRSLRSCVYDERIYEKTGVTMQLGIYHIYWQELTRLFPRDEILVLQNQDLHDIMAVMNTIVTFLDMRPFPKSLREKVFAKKQSNSRRPSDVSKGDMLDKTRRLLEDFYKPYNEEMFRITGDIAFLYNGSSNKIN